MNQDSQPEIEGGLSPALPDARGVKSSAEGSAWPAPISGPDDPRLLSIPDVIERLRGRAVEAEDPLDPISVSRRVLKDLLRGYDNADKFKWQVRDTCARAEAAEAKLSALLSLKEGGGLSSSSSKTAALLASQASCSATPSSTGKED